VDALAVAVLAFVVSFVGIGLPSLLVRRSRHHLGVHPVDLRTDRSRFVHLLCPYLEKDKSLPTHDAGPALDAGPRLGPTIAYRVPARMGFRVVERRQFNISQVTKSVR
jgi:hypothetical protein